MRRAYEGHGGSGRLAGLQAIAHQARTAGDVEMPSCRNKYWRNHRCYVAGNGPRSHHTSRRKRWQITTHSNSDNVLGQDHEMIPAPKAKPVRPVGAMLDLALARQARATRALAQVEVQVEIVQQKMEEAQREVAAADQAVADARQTAVEDVSLFADAEVLVEALKVPAQPRGLDQRTRDALERMTEALNQMKARQPQQATSTSTGTWTAADANGVARHKAELPITQDADLMRAIRQAEPDRARPRDGPALEQETEGSNDRRVEGRPSSQRPWRAVDWDGRRTEEQIHPVSQREVRSILIKKVHNENRRADVQGGQRHCLTHISALLVSPHGLV